MRAAFVVGLRSHYAGFGDAHGNAVSGWREPVDFPVYAIAPGTADEPDKARDASVSTLTLLAPATSVLVTHRDRFVVDGEEWQVDGDPAVYTRGPFGWAAGVQITLTRERG